MPSIPNTFPRGRMIWWRRTLSCAPSDSNPITLQLSLLTKEPGIARGRSAAMTAYSESIRMSLYSRVQHEGLDSDQTRQLFNHELRIYRDALVHEVGRWHADTTLNAMSTSDRDLKAFEVLWMAFAKTGVVKVPTPAYADEHFAELDEEEQSRLRFLVRDTPSLGGTVKAETIAALEAIGIPATATNLPVAIRVVMEARAAAARSCQDRREMGVASTVLNDSNVSNHSSGQCLQTIVTPATVALPSPAAPTQALPHIPEPWCYMTPLEVAEAMIAETPAMFEHRLNGKRELDQTGEQTIRQLKWAPSLLEKSLPPGKPFWQVTFEDVKEFDKQLDKLPITCGKSPWDRLPSTRLDDIIRRAEERLVEGEIAADELGLMPPTSNKHYRKLAQIHNFLREKVPGLPEVNFGKFLVPDRKDERAARLRYSLEQGIAIFSLPPWTGCRSVDDRLTPGNRVFHDCLYFILILVWYSGARREEICKLQLKDIDCLVGIWFIRIENSETGRVKNVTSQRCVPLADEVVRLGFLRYVQALKDAGETLLFPEIGLAEGSKRKRGDVFYKLWWLYLKPLIPGIKRGQAMHSVRHTVADELKQLGIFVEFRNDLAGAKNQGGDQATRYPSATKLSTLREIVNKIPVVTGHLIRAADDPITLLPPEHRKPRPTRAISK